MADRSSHRTTRARRWATRLVLTAAAAAIGLAAGSQDPARAFPVPSPVYDIIAVSGSHQASLLNLPLGQPGVPQVPVPVDIDGDLLPDVTVAVNLVDTGGVSNPPELGPLLVPNVEINRILTGSLLGQPLPPLRIEVQLRVMDVLGSEPDTVVRFGYDTGPGGSIPPAFKARLEGLDTFFNPLAATVDTGPSAGRPQTYDGPLRLVGAIDSGDSEIDLGLGFAPLPSYLRVTYGTDDAAQHITYEHAAQREVDARADIDIVDADGELHLDARVDRLPSNITVDVAKGGSDEGAIEWQSNSDGRRPDVDVHLESVGSGEDDEPLYADLDLESLAPQMGASWSLPEDGPIAVDFDAGGPSGYGVGGVDVDIRNHAAGSPGALPAFVPEQQQFLSVRQEAAPDGSVLRRISGRVERVRSLSYSDAAGVLAAEVSMGDGEQPFQVSYDCRVACSEDGSTRLVDVDTTVSPLPDDFAVSITDAGTDPRVAPMLIDYKASQPADVVGSIDLAQAGSTGSAIACGTAQTVCADVQVRDLPSELHTRLGQYTSEHDEGEVPDEADLRLAVDLGEGSIAPDLDATVVLGPENPGEDPLVAEARALALPQHTRVYLHQHKETTDEGDELALDRAAFHACDRAVDAADCVDGTEGEIGAISVSLRSFLDRPAGFPVPLHDRDQYATVDSTPAGLEVGARVEHVRDLEYLNTGTLQGVFASAGDGETPFTARINIVDSPADDVELDEERLLTGVTRDLQAEAVVTDLPPSFGVCFRTPNEALAASDTVVPGGAAFTEDCEESTLDGDPLAFAYNLDFGGLIHAPVKVEGTFATTVAGQVDGEDYSETLEGEATVPEVPTSVIVQASLPEDGQPGPIDAIYDADGAIDLTFAARQLVNDSRCLDPRATAIATCVSAFINDIPSDATVFFDPTSAVDNLRVNTDYPDNDPTARMDLLDVELSSVAPREEPIDEPFPTPQVLIVSGEVVDLPRDVHGTVVVKDDDGDGDDATQPAKTIIVCASDQACADGVITGEIGQVTLDLRNVVVADPTPLGGVGSMPDQRAALPDPTDQVIAYQRDGIFHASLDLGHISNVGYRQVASTTGQRLETDELQLGFGPDAGLDQVIRAFVDLDAGTSRTIADVTLQDVPEQTTFCFRGADLSPSVDPPASERTFCDTAPTDDEGAVQVDTVPRDGQDGLDVDAFLRTTTGGDANGIAARVVAGNIPARVEGTIPAEGRGSLDLAGFDVNGGPDGFDTFRFEIANFDIADTGYTGDLPWSRTIGKPGADFPAPALAGQHMSVVATDDGFHARGQVDGLRRIALRDGLCDAMAGPGGGDDVRDDYPYYPPAVPGTQPYTCLRTEFDEQGAGEDFNLRAVVRGEDGDILSLTDAGIERLPAVMQMTMADTEPLDDDSVRSLREPCPTFETEDGDDDGCMPPMVRLDVEAADPDNPPEIFGVLKIGSDAHLVELGETEARGNPIENATFDGTIDQMPALGANVKVGTWEPTEGYPNVVEGTAVIARMRLTLPYSLAVDPPQTWSDAQPDPDTPEWRATDLRLHYVAREDANTVVESLGELRLLVHTSPTNAQTLVTGGGVDGLNIPGELAIGVYLRDDVAGKRLFAQIDGAVSDEVNLVASILGATPPTDPLVLLSPDYEPPMERMTFEIRHLPEGPFGGWDDPYFRVQAEVVDDSPPPEDCSATSCDISDSRLREVRGLLDFHPDGSDTDPARLIKAVVRTLEDGPLGIQVAGFDTLDPNLTSSFGEGNAEITLAGELTLDPLYAYSFAGVPFLANYEVEVDTSMHVGISVDRAEDFQLFSNQLGIVTNFQGSGSATVGPLDLRPSTLYVDVTFLGATVFGLDLSPFYSASEPLDLDFFDCGAGSVVGSVLLDHFAYGSTHLLNNLPWNDDEIAFEVGTGRTDTVIFPEIDLDTMIPSGPGGFLADAFPSLRQAIGCLMFDQEEVDLINSSNPGVSEGIDGVIVAGHPVPGSDATIDDPPEVQQPPDADLLTEIGDEVMCGRNIYHGTVEITGDITVATDPDDVTFGTCLDGYGGGLEIVADEILVESGAGIDADAISTATCTSDFSATTSYNFDVMHEPNPTDQFEPLQAKQGQCNSFFAGGGGAGHNGDGGTYLAGVRHVGYDGASLTRNDPGLVTAGFPGGNGSASGGAGGGVIRLVADRVTIAGDLSADGGDGGDGAIDDPGDPCSSTLTSGGGGGSGGGIAVAANRIDLASDADISATGGDGGSGVVGGGGGAGGDVELLAGIIATAGEVNPTTNFTFVAQGSGGGSPCSDVLDGGGGTFGDERAEERPQSSVLPLGNGPGGLWWTNNDVDGDGNGEVVPVPVVAAASDPTWSGDNDTGVTIALCGVPITPETQDAEGGFRMLTPNVPNSSYLCGLRSFGEDGTSFAVPTSVLLGHTYVENDNDITAEDGVTIDVAGLDITAYVGLYTVAVRSDVAGNDCFDGDLFDFICFGRTNLDTSDPQNDCDDPFDYVGLNDPWDFGDLYYDSFWGLFQQNPGAEYDEDVCVYDNLETPPGDLGPDLVIGLDNDAPDPDDISIEFDPYDDAQIDGDNMWNNLEWIEGSVDARDRVAGTSVDLSGIDRLECFERDAEGDHLFPCDLESGFEAWTRGGQGRKVIGVTAIDRVGNRTTILDDRIVIDTTVPDSSLVALSPPDRANGWYSVSPQLELSGFPNPDPDSLQAPPHPDHRYVYQIDDGPEIDCGDDDSGEICTITGTSPLVLPGDGMHRVWYTAVDRAGNRDLRCDECVFNEHPMSFLDLGMDDDPPLADNFAAPITADGENGWYRTAPWIGVGFYDPPVGGSGIVLNHDPSLLEVELIGPGEPAGFDAYAGPFQLGDGTFTVQARARDDAGNPWPLTEPPSLGPVHEYRVDATPPSLLLLSSGPLGSGGWFTGGATVTPIASDFGSGMDPLADLAGVSGVFVSIDDGPFLESGPVFIGEGEHVVRAYAVDVAGNRTTVQEKVVKVDLSHPVSALRTTPADPARDPWFRSQPTIVLRATDGDQNAGVSSVRYCFGAGCTPTTTYTGPFTAPVGVTTVRWQALDLSGGTNNEPIRQQVLRSDITPPVGVATQASKLIWSRLLGPSTIQLGFTVKDELAGPLQATVVIYDVFGNPVRRIDAAPINVNAGQTVSSSVTWDGKGTGLALVPLGIYHYRVVVTDHAGNISESGESKPITIKLL